MNARGISSGEQILAAATKAAIQAAGGLDVCARETGLSTSQLSRCCSPHSRDSLTLRDAATIEAITHGAPGHPHMLRAIARLLDFLPVPLPSGIEDGQGLLRSVADIAAELGEVAQAIVDALSGDGRVDAIEAGDVTVQLDQLDIASASLRLKRRAITGDTAQPASAPARDPP